MLWLETKVVVCFGTWYNAGQNVMLKKSGDSSCKRNSSEVLSIICVPIFIFTVTIVVTSIPVEFFHALNTP